jgi:hypothetical protein
MREYASQAKHFAPLPHVNGPARASPDDRSGKLAGQGHVRMMTFDAGAFAVCMCKSTNRIVYYSVVLSNSRTKVRLARFCILSHMI